MTVLKHQGAICNNSTISEGICIDNPKKNYTEKPSTQAIVLQNTELRLEVKGVTGSVTDFYSLILKLVIFLFLL